MGKRVFFQLCLTPQNPRDQLIIEWLNAIPRYRRSPSIKDVLSRHIQGGVLATNETDRAPTRHDAGRLASRLLGSLPKRRG